MVDSISQPAQPLEFHELDGSDTHNNTVLGTWQNWDMSGFLPAGAKWVEVLLYGTTNGSSTGIRKDGSAQDRRFNRYANGVQRFVDMADLPDTLIVETYQSHDLAAAFQAIGYWI